MAARDEETPRYCYVLAVFAGLVGLPILYALVDTLAAGALSKFLDGAMIGDYRIVWVATGLFAFANAVFGAVFGLAWPEQTWRWGVWLCAVPVCLISFFAGNVWDFLACVAVTLVPACLGAYAAGKLHLKFTAVDESG